MKFLWSIFAKGLGFVLQFLMMKAAQTPQKWDDAVLEWSQSVAKIFLPQYMAVWDEQTAQWNNLTPKSGGSLVRSIGAIAWKDIMLNKDFVAKTGLNELQVQNLLVLGMSYFKPDAVDTEAEVDALIAQVKDEFTK